MIKGGNPGLVGMVSQTAFPENRNNFNVLVSPQIPHHSRAFIFSLHHLAEKTLTSELDNFVRNPREHYLWLLLLHHRNYFGPT